jgi:hypothetical protein
MMFGGAMRHAGDASHASTSASSVRLSSSVAPLARIE